MQEILDTVLTAVISGSATGVITLIALKNDVKWLKEILASHDARITYIERKKVNERN